MPTTGNSETLAVPVPSGCGGGVVGTSAWGLLPIEPGRGIETLETHIFDHDHRDPLGGVCALVRPGEGERTRGRPVPGGWLVMLSYELGRVIEPKAGWRPPGPGGFPLAVAQRWAACDALTPEPGGAGGFRVGALRSSMGRAGYMRGVERIRGDIGAGDIYQANLAHHLGGSFEGSVNACSRALGRLAAPRYGATMVFDHRGRRHGVCSISPELFLAYDPVTRVLRTEPMKGTRPAAGGSVSELRDSVKDRAELDMITDLMRNDLGRVCAPGSMRVIDPRRIEAHGSGVLQASSLIEGRVRPGLGLREIIGATFPPGSVTGAPKVRAMQIIDELEDQPRGPYCGSLFSIEDSGAFTAAVSIRTAHIRGEIDPGGADLIRGGRFVFPVGAGIVADSVAGDEWEETLTKAGVLAAALGVGIERG